MKAYFRRHSRQKIAAICLALALLYAVPFFIIPGNAAGYIKIDGIDGESTASGYEKWIDITSVSLGAKRTIELQPDGTREKSSPSISEIVVTKEVDKSSPKLFLEAILGPEGKDAEIHLTRQVGDMETAYLKYKLSDVLVSSYQTSTGGDRPTESMSLNFVAIEYEYTPFVDGQPQEPVTVFYDLRERQ